MADPIYIRLSSSGRIREAPLPDGATKPWHACSYGEFLGTFYGYLDDYAIALSVPKVTSFMDNPEDEENEPVSHDPEDGLKTFAALVNELIARMGTNDGFEHIECVLWEVRMCELILRQASIDREKFYLG